MQVPVLTEIALRERNSRPLQLVLFLLYTDLKLPSPSAAPLGLRSTLPAVRDRETHPNAGLRGQKDAITAGDHAAKGATVRKTPMHQRHPPGITPAVPDDDVHGSASHHAAWFRRFCFGESKEGQAAQGQWACSKDLHLLIEALVNTLPWAPLEALTLYKETFLGVQPSPSSSLSLKQISL